MWSMGVDTEPIFDEFILNLKSIDTDSHFDVLFKIIQGQANRNLESIKYRRFIEKIG